MLFICHQQCWDFSQYCAVIMTISTKTLCYLCNAHWSTVDGVAVKCCVCLSFDDDEVDDY